MVTFATDVSTSVKSAKPSEPVPVAEPKKAAAKSKTKKTTDKKEATKE